MALIKCPECGKEISDKSKQCIHCGYPIDLYVQGEESLNTDVNKIVNKADELRENKQYIEALALYEKAATLGHARSQVWVGNFYERGLGVTIDYAKAHYWFEKAADQNDTDAISNLARLYARGLGIPKNINRAIELYKKASEQGNATASGNLASLYDFGDGLEANYKLAVQYYKLALEQGSQESVVLNNLAVCYMDGKGTAPNPEKAEELLKKAITLGSKSAKDNLEILYKNIAQSTQSNPIKPNLESAPITQNGSKKNGGCGWIIAILVLLGLMFIGSIDSGNDGDRTCAWCNGTGYSGNGATNAIEYVFEKTPCKHCNGKGTY